MKLILPLLALVVLPFVALAASNIDFDNDDEQQRGLKREWRPPKLPTPDGCFEMCSKRTCRQKTCRRERGQDKKICTSACILNVINCSFCHKSCNFICKGLKGQDRRDCKKGPCKLGRKARNSVKYTCEDECATPSPTPAPKPAPVPPPLPPAPPASPASASKVGGRARRLYR